MGFHSKNKEDEEASTIESLCKREYESHNIPPYTWYPTVNNIQQISYVRRLECEYEILQSSLLNLTSQLARLQFRIRQIIKADPCDRSTLINELERIVLKENNILNECQKEELPSLATHHQQLGDIKKKQHLLIEHLRCQIGDFKTASDSLITQYRYDGEWEKDQEKKCYCPDLTVLNEGPLTDQFTAATSKSHSESSKTSVASKWSKVFQKKRNTRKSGGCEHLILKRSTISVGSQTDENLSDWQDEIRKLSPSNTDISIIY